MKQLVTFIVNPFSGTSQKGNLEGLIKKHLDSRKYHYQISYTETAGHATMLSKEAVSTGSKIIVAVGGDGSVNEVAQSLLHKDACLGILPGGSGNGFAMHLGLGRNVEKAIGHINTGKPKLIDTCTVNDKFFLNLAGVGYDARIAYLTKQNKKRGFFPYFKTSMKEAINYRPVTLEITLDGDTFTGKYAMAIVANASMFGYYFTIAPPAKFDDGLLDLVLINDAPIIKYIASSYRFLNRSLHKSNITDFYQASDIKIKVLEDDYFHIDGEGMLSEKELHFRVVPNSLKVICPQSTVNH